MLTDDFYTGLRADMRAAYDTLVAFRRHLHRHPEISGQEFETAAYIAERLNAMGIPARRMGDTGVLGTVRGTAAAPADWQDGAPVVALRADIDALSICETASRPYASQNAGVMHACGHDAHTAALLGAAAWLAAHTDRFFGEIRLIFQPAEEIGAGTAAFFAAGVMEGVYRVFGLHMAPDVPAGSVGLKPGLNNASVDHFTISISGRAAHVSTPQLGADAAYIASQLVVALQGVVTRLYAPVEPVILGVGKISAGTAYNIVAAEATLEGTTRAVTHKTRASLKAQIDATAAAVANLYGGDARVEWEDFAPPLINDDIACREAAAAAAGVFCDGQVLTDRPLSLGGDNFADFLQGTPGAYAYLGTGNPAKPATMLPLHNDGFDIDEAVLPLGAGLYVACALHWLAQAAKDGQR